MPSPAEELWREAMCLDLEAEAQEQVLMSWWPWTSHLGFLGSPPPP